ncbi:MAG: DUF4058 family protein [Caldilineaceae bacterium]
MPSPFPGMDPYIETQRNWSDFHADLATEIRARLNMHIQPDYYATAVTYVAYDVIEIARKDTHSAFPDVGVWKSGATPPTERGLAALDTVIDPPQAQSQVRLEAPFRLANVEVRQAATDLLVTALEILSPINKRTGREREKYLRKRRELLRSEVHVMEIDFLRGGQRSPLEIQPPPAPYYVTLGRADARPTLDVWAIQLDARLPVVPVPLLAPDPDVPLDLGAVVHSVYARGAYATRIDYRQPAPPPPLDEKQAAWVEELLASYRKQH